MTTDEPNSPHLIEAGKRLSESFLWRLQRQFYDAAGQDAWASGTIPCYITTNPFVAREYARLIHAYMLDLKREGKLSEDAPLTVVEIGAGHGHFGFLCLKKLLSLRQRAGAGLPPLRYVMTDFTHSNVLAWQAAKHLQGFIEQGVLDFASFDAETSTGLHLLLADEELQPGSLQNPVVVIANYVFDSLLQDVFRVERGRLQECLPRIRSTQAEPDLEVPDLMGRLIVDYEFRDIETSYYGDAVLDPILETYAAKLDDTAFMMPVGAFTCLRNLAALSNGRMLLLSADKGATHLHELLNRFPPSPVTHGGCFSFSVNYDALRRFFENRGGCALIGAARQSLAMAGFVQGTPREELQSLALTYFDGPGSFGPGEYLSLTRLVRDAVAAEAGSQPDLSHILALLRLSAWDPQVFYPHASSMIDRVEDASEALKTEVASAVRHIWDNYVPSGDGRDIPYELGRICFRLKDYLGAIRYYEASNQVFKEHPATLANIGVSYWYLQQLERALACFERALEIDPDFARARGCRLRVLAEIEDSRSLSGVRPAASGTSHEEG